MVAVHVLHCVAVKLYLYVTQLSLLAKQFKIQGIPSTVKYFSRLWMQSQLRDIRSDVRPLSRYRSTPCAGGGNGWQWQQTVARFVNSMDCVLCNSVMLVIRTERERVFVLSQFVSSLYLLLLLLNS
jgi:hypothetical protein